LSGPQAPRILLGTSAGLATRERIYRIEDALEVDDVDHYEIIRRRVFFEDILLVTWHRELGWAFLLAFGLLTLLFATIGVAIAVASADSTGLIVAVTCALPFAVPFGLRLLLRLDVITVYGRRSRARICFSFRKARAKAVYGEICQLAATHQDRLASEIHAAGTPTGEPPSSPEPLPPQEASSD
jgi:hypothetical protein